VFPKRDLIDLTRIMQRRPNAFNLSTGNNTAKQEQNSAGKKEEQKNKSKTRGVSALCTHMLHVEM